MSKIPKIKEVTSREILDSRGAPTIETAVLLSDGTRASASVPSGTSVGSHEALELRDNDRTRFFGQGVLKAVTNAQEKIGPRITGIEVTRQKEIDSAMVNLDGTENKASLGANAILSVSLAVARAAAQSLGKSLYAYLNELFSDISHLKLETSRLPVPLFNLINGGKHGCGSLDFQEFLLAPAVFMTFKERIEAGVEIYQGLKKTLEEKGFLTSVGLEGGFTPTVKNEEALDLIVKALNQSRYKLDKDVFLGLDLAATHFQTEGYYNLSGQKSLSTDELINLLCQLNEKYHFLLLEDPFAEDDWQGWQKLNEKLGQKTLIAGDDLLTTNLKRLKMAVTQEACSTVVVKPNQIGTLNETLQFVKVAKEANLRIVIAHRSGETNDAFVADLAVAVGADFVKFGAPSRGERVAKYNRLLAIEDELGKNQKCV